MSEVKRHWEYRYPKLAITCFWVLWICALLAILPLFLLQLIAIIVNNFYAAVVHRLSMLPWKLTAFLLKDRVSACQKN